MIRPDVLLATIQETDAYSQKEPASLKFDEKEIILVNPKQNKSVLGGFFDKIKNDINIYLIKNKGAATDFFLIKDIVDRNVDVKYEEIEQRITQPLYFGLGATMVGIIIGLFGLMNEVDSNSGNSSFLIGVAVAMCGSLSGLLLTVLNYRAKASAFHETEVKKNEFYTFIQVELLPALSQSIANSIYSLQQNFAKFEVLPIV